MNKYLNSAKLILRNSRNGLHVNAITDFSLKKKILVNTGKTPIRSMHAQLIRDIKKFGTASAFIKVAPATFALRSRIKYVKIHSKKKKKTVSQKGALVKGYLEKKDRDGFEMYFSKYKKVIGRRSGIYALYNNDKLYYVGIAKNLMRRVNAHMKNKHKNKWDSVSFFVIDRHLFSKDVETLILRITAPKGNATKGKFEKHDELQDHLNEIRKEIMEEIAQKI